MSMAWEWKKDEHQAIGWYKKAAEQGHAVAQLNLGWIYANSPSRKNWEQAVYWYKQAAEQGDPPRPV